MNYPNYHFRWVDNERIQIWQDGSVIAVCDYEQLGKAMDEVSIDTDYARWRTLQDAFVFMTRKFWPK